MTTRIKKGLGLLLSISIVAGTVLFNAPTSASSIINVINVATAQCMIAAGAGHSLALKEDGSVWAWGYNNLGQLGNGESGAGVFESTPVKVSNLKDVIAVAAGYAHSLALKNDGSVWAWGRNVEGQLGNGKSGMGAIENNIPILVHLPNTRDIVAIAAGDYWSFALTEDGSVWAWGNNGSGQLGIGKSGGYEPTPVKVPINDVTALSAANGHSLALKADGSVWAWGRNHHGQLGIGKSGEGAIETTAVKVSNLNGIIAIAAQALHSLALKDDGSVWAWGYNGYGELGNGKSDGMGGPGSFEDTPVRALNLNGIIAIGAGHHYSLALKGDGSLWGWGQNTFGQFGNGKSGAGVFENTPVMVSNQKDTIAIAVGRNHTLVLKEDGSVWAWGDNSDGQLGNGDSGSGVFGDIPVRVNGLVLLSPPTTTLPQNPTDTEGNNLWWILIVLAGVLGAGLVVMLVIRAKKSS